MAAPVLTQAAGSTKVLITWVTSTAHAIDHYTLQITKNDSSTMALDMTQCSEGSPNNGTTCTWDMTNITATGAYALGNYIHVSVAAWNSYTSTAVYSSVNADSIVLQGVPTVKTTGSSATADLSTVTITWSPSPTTALGRGYTVLTSYDVSI